MHINAQQRQKVLERLYDARADKPRGGWLYEHELRDSLGEIEFALVVLADLGYLSANGARYRITGAGVLACEAAEG